MTARISRSLVDGATLVPEEHMAELNKANGRDYLHSVAKTADGYLAQIDAYHQLHCLVSRYSAPMGQLRD